MTCCGIRLAIQTNDSGGSICIRACCISLWVIVTPVAWIVSWISHWLAAGNCITICSIWASSSSVVRLFDRSFASHHKRVLYNTSIIFASSFWVYPTIRSAWIADISKWMIGQLLVSDYDFCISKTLATWSCYSCWSCWSSLCLFSLLLEFSPLPLGLPLSVGHPLSGVI